MLIEGRGEWSDGKKITQIVNKMMRINPQRRMIKPIGLINVARHKYYDSIC